MHQDERVSGLELRMSGRSPRSGCHRRGRSGASSRALDTNRYQRDKGAAALDMSLYMQTVSGSECERGIHVGGCSTVELLADECFERVSNVQLAGASRINSVPSAIGMIEVFVDG